MKLYTDILECRHQLTTNNRRENLIKRKSQNCLMKLRAWCNQLPTMQPKVFKTAGSSLSANASGNLGVSDLTSTPIITLSLMATWPNFQLRP